MTLKLEGVRLLIFFTSRGFMDGFLGIPLPLPPSNTPGVFSRGRGRIILRNPAQVYFQVSILGILGDIIA